MQIYPNPSISASRSLKPLGNGLKTSQTCLIASVRIQEVMFCWDSSDMTLNFEIKISLHFLMDKCEEKSSRAR